MVITKFSDFVETNPKIQLDKGEEYEFVEMTDVTPGKRYVYSQRKRKLKGGGSKFQSGDVLFARITPCLEHGKIVQFKSVSDKPAFGSTEFFVFRKIDGVSDQGYIFYLSLTDTIRKPAEKSMVGASGRQRASLETIRNIEFDASELPEQKKIATILSNHDDLIENNTKRMQLLEKMAKMIYHEWFVKFKFPGHENIKMVDSELGKIPEGWEIGEIQDIIENVKHSIKRSELTPNLRYIPIDVIPRKSMLLNEIKPLSDAQSSLTLFEEGDIVFGSMRSYFHKVILAPFKGVTRKTCFTLRAKSQELWSYSYLTLFQESTVAYANQHSKGATIPYAVWDNGLANMKIVIPKKRILERFDTSLGPILKTVMKTFFKDQNLSKTRDLLLPKLISGQVDVSDLDIKVPKVVEAEVEA